VLLLALPLGNPVLPFNRLHIQFALPWHPNFFLGAIPVGNKLVPVGNGHFTTAGSRRTFALQNSKDVLNCTTIVKASDH